VTLARVHKEHYKAAKEQLAAQPKSKQFDFDEQVGGALQHYHAALPRGHAAAAAAAAAVAAVDELPTPFCVLLPKECSRAVGQLSGPSASPARPGRGA